MDKQEENKSSPTDERSRKEPLSSENESQRSALEVTPTALEIPSVRPEKVPLPSATGPVSQVEQSIVPLAMPQDTVPQDRQLPEIATDTTHNWRECIALVTGISSPVAKAVVTALLAEGIQSVFGCDDTIEGYSEHESVQEWYMDYNIEDGFQPILCDISNEIKVREMLLFIKEISGTFPTVVVNCKEVVITRYLLDLLWTEISNTFKTNVQGAVVIARETAKAMIDENKNGHIVFLNSMYGHVVPDVEGKLYSATKFAVTTVADGLRKELTDLRKALGDASSNIYVSSISPSFMHPGDSASKDFRAHPKHVADAVINALNNPDVRDMYLQLNDCPKVLIDLTSETRV